MCVYVVIYVQSIIYRYICIYIYIYTYGCTCAYVVKLCIANSQLPGRSRRCPSSTPSASGLPAAASSTRTASTLEKTKLIESR